MDAPRCELVSEGLNALITSARALLERSALPPWDARALQGFWRHLVLRESWAGGRLVGIYTSPPPDGQEAVAEAELQAWAESLPADVVAAWYVNPRTGDAAVGDLRAALKGEPALIERIGEVAFRLSPTAFFQTNTPAARALYERVGEALGLVPGARRDARLVDLYCGAGAIGLSLASRVREVLGVELNPEAVNDARVNAALNNIPATFIAGAVEDVLPALGADDLAVVDRPGRACTPGLGLARQALRGPGLRRL
ncbi:MAG: class I SAM-dependent RNA methyltransferase [Sandaracinaceae bacterium]|nr:class I SAM-dependent RNA methyltransferase [Sandaracinaceae bacterium]